MLGLAVVAMVAFSGLAKAASSEAFHLVVVVASDEIAVDVTGVDNNGYVNLGVVQAGNALVTSSGQHSNVMNVGYGTIDLQLQAVTNANNSTWTQRTDAPSNPLNANEYRLGGIFTQWDRSTIAASDFGADDIFQTTATTCTATVHAFDSEADGVKGFNVAPGASRALHYMFQAPSTVSNPGEVVMDLVVSAVLHI